LYVDFGFLTRSQNDRHARALREFGEDDDVTLQQLQRRRGGPGICSDLMIDQNDGGILDIETQDTIFSLRLHRTGCPTVLMRT